MNNCVTNSSLFTMFPNKKKMITADDLKISGRKLNSYFSILIKAIVEVIKRVIAKTLVSWKDWLATEAVTAADKTIMKNN